LPEFPNLGWRIGRGCASFGNRGVDFLLCKEDEEDEDNSEDRVTNIHARFNWVKGAGGFFIIADNNERRKVILDGEIVRADQRPIQFENTIIIGECLFTLRYESRNREENDNFDIKLGQFFDKFHQDNNPLILPTPSERFSQFKEWIFHYPIAKGVFGTVYMVTNSRTGEPAAAKRIFRSGRNSRNVDREISMVRRISKLVHVSYILFQYLVKYRYRYWLLRGHAADNVKSETTFECFGNPPIADSNKSRNSKLNRLLFIKMHFI
jgi:hypothetical protein